MAVMLMGFAGFTGHAQTIAADELLPLLPQWDGVVTWRNGGGYKDNVFLAHSDKQGSAFLSTSVEALLFRLPSDGLQFNFFGDAEANYFLSDDAEHAELTAFAQAELKQEWHDVWLGSLAAEYFYQDQVLDLSVTETNRESADVLGHTVTLRPALRRDLGPSVWVSVEIYGSRLFYQKPLDDQWQSGSRLTAAYEYGYGSQLSASYELSWRSFDSDPSRNSIGDAVTNSHRFQFQQEARLVWKHNWDESRHWRTTMTISGRLNDENGEGYYDYSRWLVSSRLQYRRKPWDISLEGRLLGYHYDTQTVSASDSTKRKRTEWSVELRAERALTRHLTLTTAVEYEETHSNDKLENYAVTTVSGGLNWEF